MHPQPPSTTGAPARVAAFDGLRGLAVAAVILFHSQFAWARGGFLGVSAFFTLSGFLITSLLLDEHARAGRVSLKSFWSRRARRLLPAAWLALAGVLLYGATVASADQVRSLRGDVFGAFFDVANWRFYAAGRSYEQLFTAPSPVLHFWSLAIEEQFYLLFPLLVVGGLRLARGRRAVFGGALALAAVASMGAAWFFSETSGQSRAYYGTDTRASELLVGALLAILCAGDGRRPVNVRLTRRGRVLATAAACGALAVLAWWWTSVEQTDTWLTHGGFTAHAVLVAIVIAVARVDGPVARGLSWRPLVALGAISYGVYLFHWPIFLWLTPERTGLAAAPLFAVRVALTLGCAVLSYRLLERPVLRGDRLRGSRPRLVAPALAAALAAVLVATTWSPPAQQIVLRSLAETSPAAALHASPPAALPSRPPPAPRPPRALSLARPVGAGRPLRVMVVGDSVGLTFGRGVELWARQEGNAVVRNLGRLYCPLGREIPIQAGLQYLPDVHACNWTDRWRAEVESFDPDVTLVLFTIWEGSARKLPGESAMQHPGDAAFDAWQLSEYEAAADTLSAHGGRVVWLTVPCDEKVRVNARSGLLFVNQRTIPRVADTRPLVHVLDLDGAVCPGGAFARSLWGVADARPDGAHFSDAGALAAASWAMPIVLGQAPAPPYPREPSQLAGLIYLLGR